MPSVQHRRLENPQQPRRELSPADPATRAGDETLQVDPARATIPSAFSGISPHFRARLHLLSAADYRRRWPTASRSGTRSPGRRPRPPPNRRPDRTFRPSHGLSPESSHRPIRLAQVDNAPSKGWSRLGSHPHRRHRRLPNLDRARRPDPQPGQDQCPRRVIDTAQAALMRQTGHDPIQPLSTVKSFSGRSS